MNRLLLLTLLLLGYSSAALAQGSPALKPVPPVSPLFFSAPATTTSAAPVKKPGYKFREEWTSDQATTHFYGSTDSARYTYDAFGNETSYILYTYQTATDSFVPFERTLKQYSADNRLQHESYWAWRADDWLEAKRTYYKYGNGITPDSAIVQSNNYSTAPWTNNTLTTTRRDSKGEVIEWLFHVWRNGSWEPSMGEKYSRTGLTNGHFQEEIYQVYRTSGWSDTKKTVNTIANGRVTERVEYLASAGSWNPSSRYADFVYNGTTDTDHLQLAYTRYIWSNNTWTKSTRYSSYSFPDNTTLTTEEASTAENTWLPQLRHQQRFSDLGQLVSSVRREERNGTVLERTDTLFYNYPDGTLADDYSYTTRNGSYAGKHHIRYGDYVTVTSPTAVPREKKSSAELYPNPTQHLVFVEPHTTTGEPITVEALDTKGNLLLRQELRQQEKTVVDLSKEPAGLYLVRVLQGTSVQTYKVLKL